MRHPPSAAARAVRRLRLWAAWALPAGREGRLRPRASSTACHTVAGAALERQASAVQRRHWGPSWRRRCWRWATACWPRAGLVWGCLGRIARARLQHGQRGRHGRPGCKQLARMCSLTTPGRIITEIHCGVIVVAVESMGLRLSEVQVPAFRNSVQWGKRAQVTHLDQRHLGRLPSSRHQLDSLGFIAAENRFLDYGLSWMDCLRVYPAIPS